MGKDGSKEEKNKTAECRVMVKRWRYEIIFIVLGTIFIDFESPFHYNFSRWFNMIDKKIVKAREF
jgi:hypothetical protein